jgi:hypothetical protein
MLEDGLALFGRSIRFLEIWGDSVDNYTSDSKCPSLPLLSSWQGRQRKINNYLKAGKGRAGVISGPRIRRYMMGLEVFEDDL